MATTEYSWARGRVSNNITAFARLVMGASGVINTASGTGSTDNPDVQASTAGTGSSTIYTVTLDNRFPPTIKQALLTLQVATPVTTPAVVKSLQITAVSGRTVSFQMINEAGDAGPLSLNDAVHVCLNTTEDLVGP